jgi:hypothetical protein
MVGETDGDIDGETLGLAVGAKVTHTLSSLQVPTKQSISDLHFDLVGDMVGKTVGFAVGSDVTHTLFSPQIPIPSRQSRSNWHDCTGDDVGGSDGCIVGIKVVQTLEAQIPSKHSISDVHDSDTGLAVGIENGRGPRVVGTFCSPLEFAAAANDLNSDFHACVSRHGLSLLLPPKM